MGARWHRACLASIAAVGVAMGSSCQEHTAIVIDVSAGLPASELHGVTFTVGGPGETEDAEPTTATNDARDDGTRGSFVGTLVAVPSSSDDAPVSVRVVAGVGSVRAYQCTARNGYRGCIVARRSLRYQPHVRLQLPIVLDPACTDVPCDAVTTCKTGRCVSAQVTCSGADCATLSTLEDGGTRYVDAPTIGDAYVQGDGASSADASDASSADASDTDSGATPGAIKCAATSCTGGAVCCAYAGLSMCIGNASTCTIPAIRVECDGAEDCAHGEVCCAVQSKIACSQVGCAPKTEVCHRDQDCHTPGERCTNTYVSMYGGCQ